MTSFQRRKKLVGYFDKHLDCSGHGVWDVVLSHEEMRLKMDNLAAAVLTVPMVHLYALLWRVGVVEVRTNQGDQRLVKEPSRSGRRK